MSAPSTESHDPQAAAASAPVSPEPPRRPRLPIIQFHSDKQGMDVYLSLREAIDAAHAAHHDAFYDVRGIKLTAVKQGKDGVILEARGKADADGLQQRVTGLLHQMAKAEAHGAKVPPEVQAVLDWFDASPGVDYTVNALSLVEPNYAIFKSDTASKSCRTCNWVQKTSWGSPPCCPG